VISNNTAANRSIVAWVAAATCAMTCAAAIAPRIYIRYYVIPCHNIIAPWPDLHIHVQIQLGHGSVDARLALAERLRDIAERPETPHFADFGVRPTEEYLPALIEGLRAEKAGKG